MKTFCLSIGQVACFLGVCTKTLRRWDSEGKLISDFRTVGNHRRYSKARILNIIQERKNKTTTLRSALYGRVSSSRQVKSGALKRQLSALKSYSRKRGHVIHKSYSDVGSGLNDKRRGLLKLLSDASLGKFEVVVVNYNDRLARFGLQIIKEYLNSWNVHLEITHPNTVDDSPQAELIANLTAILYSFMGKLYRMRRDR